MKKTILFSLVTLMFAGYQVQAAQGTAKAKLKVVQSINVTTTSDLIFSEAGAGAAEETVLPDTSENAQNASFEITGEPNRAVTVTLPGDGVVVMKTAGGGSPESEVAVNQFTSNSIPDLGGAGQATLFVGATRAALASNQVAGDYEADFIVDVVY